jgi:hypothetical protein
VQPPVGWDDIDVVCLQWSRLSDLEDWHVRSRSQDIRHLAALIWIKMQHHDKGGAGILRQRGEQLL